MRPPVSNAARGQLRVLWASLAAEAERVTTAIEAVPTQLLRAVRLKGDVGSERALVRVRNAIPVVPFFASDRAVAWRFLQPMSRLPDLDEGTVVADQPAVIVHGVLFGVDGRRKLRPEPLGLAVTAHAIGRLLDRSAGQADPVRAILSAHDALLALPPPDGARVLALPDVTLPAAAGAFLATPTRIAITHAPLAVCRTWLSQDQISGPQAAHLGAWTQLLGGIAA